MRKLVVAVVLVFLAVTAESSTLIDLKHAEKLDTLPRAHLTGVCTNILDFIEIGKTNDSAKETIAGFLVWRGIRAFTSIPNMYAGCFEVVTTDITLQDAEVEAERINNARHTGECSNMNMLIRFHQEGKDVSGTVLKNFITSVAKGWNKNLIELVDHCAAASRLYNAHTGKNGWIPI